jgi:hypothetical protein
MKNAFIKSIPFLFFFALFSCVDLYDPNLKNEKSRIVIEGRITTEFDFQWIYLTYDAGYNSNETNFSNLVKNAKVWVTDDFGNSFDFIDDTNPKGNVLTGLGFDYRSKNKFSAVVGRTYKLFVETQNGKSYVSKEEKIRAVPPIGKIYSEFRKTPAFALNPIGEFLIYTDLKDSPETGEYYQWETIHQEQIEICRYWVLRDNVRPPELFQDKCCGDCWESSICQECKQFASDKFTNGKEIRKKLLGKAPYTDTKPYYLMVKQYSISEATYKFWNTIQTQALNSGGLFDSTPQSIKGNIVNPNDANEEVLGIFSACDVSELVYYVDRNITGYRPFDPPISSHKTTNVCYKCFDGPTRSSTPPKGWKNLK